MSECVDVAVVGGGPAGAIASTLLARGGRRVVVLERERFPRYHIGESLLSATLPILEHAGVLPAVEAAGFVKKPGGTFLWGTRAEPWSFFFRDDPGGFPHAFHVLRSEFDEILLRHAAAQGADVREGVTVTALEGEGPVRVRARDESGRELALEASLAVDASGQQALLGGRHRLRELDPFFRNLALWSYYEGAGRMPAPFADNILSAAYDEGWCWYIPLHDGTVSVGTVIDAKRWRGEAQGDRVESLYERLVARCAPVTSMLAGAQRVAPVRVIRDYSYSSRRFFAGGTLLAGDAACFIDPVFSTGVHLACLAGVLAADAIDRVLGGALDPAVSFERYDADYRRAFERYRRFVAFFYNHHADEESYFWQARKLVDPGGALAPREAFVHLVAGTRDFDEMAAEIRRTDERWAESLADGRARSAPGMHLMRVAATIAQLGGRRATV